MNNNKLTNSILKKGMIIRFKKDENNPMERNWIVLEVTEKDLKRGFNADKVGLYAFGGLWYDRNPMKIKSYGKISSIDNDYNVLFDNIIGMKVDVIKYLVE